MKAKLSSSKTPIVAITGHAGAGHCHSHNRYTQDDSGGLAVTLYLLSEATGVSLTIADIDIKTGINGYFEITTESGGVSRTYPRRGITLQEAKLAYNILGEEAICSQSLVTSVFGRFYGQGISESPVSLQTAIANAAINSFHRNYPENFIYGEESITGNCGSFTATILDINNIPTAVMALVNATDGGIGPNEDLEGNCYAGGKGEAMKKLGMIDIPTIIVEGKVYTPLYCDQLKNNTFLIRADMIDDNPIVANAMYDAAVSIGEHSQFRKDIMKRTPNAFAKMSNDFGKRIVDAGERLAVASTSYDKVRIVAEIAEMISQDAAGITFMSNDLHGVIGGIGLMPATAAVISYLVTKEYHERYIMPYLTVGDLIKFVNIIKIAVENISINIDDAKKHIDQYAFQGDINSYIKY